jgi:hypothetical protein
MGGDRRWIEGHRHPVLAERLAKVQFRFEGQAQGEMRI